MRPDYQAEVERLSNCTPKQIYKEWNEGAQFHPLFGCIKGLGGCLTEAKYWSNYPFGLDDKARHVIDLIRADGRIPNPLDPDKEEIDPAVLPVFAEWNERIDDEFRFLR